MTTKSVARNKKRKVVTVMEEEKFIKKFVNGFKAFALKTSWITVTLS